KTMESPADISSIRTQLGTLNLGDVQVQQFGGPDEVLVRVQQPEGGEMAQQAVVSLVRESFGESVEFRRVEVVGPRVSGELAQAGLIAVVASLLVILFYIWFRFEWHFAVGAILTTINDIVVTIGLFVVLQLDQPAMVKVFIACLAAFIGFYAPDLYLKNKIQKRQLSINRAWPDALDLMLICVESGMSIEVAFRRVSDEIGIQSIPLAEELTLTNAELSYLGDRRMAYENLANRTGLEG
ncbi:hypothetical protein HKX42_10340, partial [Salinisphaera sp. USBA-960]|nr:hypothetical protein [Salifodinibacter halophilus]